MAGEIAVVGVVGAGTMGAGIGQVALEAGHEVVLYDVDEIARERGVQRIRDGLARRAAKLDLDADAVDDWVDGRLADVRHAHTLEALGAEAGLGIVFEAAAELLELKQDVFRALDASTEPDVILATNTSSLSVTDIAGVMRDAGARDRRALLQPGAGDAPRRGGPGSGHDGGGGGGHDRSARGVGQGPGALRRRARVHRESREPAVHHRGAADPGDGGGDRRDDRCRDARRRLPDGPVRADGPHGDRRDVRRRDGDLGALGRPERLRPSPIQQRLVDDGRLGRKTGRGFYDHATGRPAEPPAVAASESATALGPEAVVRRIRGAILDEARFAAAEGVASEDDIDLALRLGASHPQGPFAWAASGEP